MQVARREAAPVGEQDGHGRGERPQRADGDSAGYPVRAEDGVRIMVRAGDDPVDLAGADAGRAVVHCGHGYIAAIASSGMDCQEGRYLAS